MPIRFGERVFDNRVQSGIENTFMRGAVSGAQERLFEKKAVAEEELGDWEEWRLLGEEIRQHTIENLDYYLQQLTDVLSARGGHVYFAETADEANQYIQAIAKQKKAKKIVKSKSMVTEEIGMNAVLESLGCEVIETDLGEYILQLDDHDPPSHVVAPALHKNKEQIRDVFKEKIQYTKTEDPKELARYAREMLREEFLKADIGITGCNFAVAETGSIALVTNEGNARLCTALPKTQITVMGMERIVPTFEELDIMVSLLCRSAVGQKLTSYITSLTGPIDETETDGPEEFHLVILDNGRSNILGTAFQSALHCIRCAACMNVCPVYRHVGGHAYGSIYPGPIGAVLTPLLDGYDDHKELPYASTLCAACTDACPVRIPLHELLNEHRKVIVEKNKKQPLAERAAMQGFKTVTTSAKLFQWATKAAPYLTVPWARHTYIQKGPGPLADWTDSRDFPAPKAERFRDWYKAHREEKANDKRTH
ncbi:LutB/LldF family L-lactate oxidation iron-sulfur protein [Aureibacillus halotolerans]|uniref:Lactate utilization protein B n=1 Tax=Aureibacillus halotolerans TaxID=1508390 RepID=A0A4R6U773_9BACI|nr:LutB/LldF family L-lactate oxidation iron-sulfur protein [Aureibacillus halotolerans]TDQ42181.1 L-lactate dehydrogenase complex protein LldF [Aureibacillus halotolerans]